MSGSNQPATPVTGNFSVPGDVHKWIEDNVKGRIAPIDISSIKQESVCIIEEDFSHTEQVRCATYFDHLTGKKKELKAILHEYKVSPDEFCQRWRKFNDDRLSNVRRSDHPLNGGTKITAMRTYAPPKEGKPGRLRCANSYQDLYRPFRNRLLEPVCSDLDMVCAAGTFALWIAVFEGAKRNNLESLVSNPKAWRREFAQEAGISEKAVKGLLVKMWTCNPKQNCKDYKDFPAYRQLYDEVQSLKIQTYKNPKWQWVYPYCDSDNIYGTFFGIIIYALEAAVTNACIRFAKEQWRWNVQAIVHDGFNPMGKFNRRDHGFYLLALNAVAKELLPGINLKWDWKEFDFWFYHKKTGEKLRELEIPATWQIPIGDEEEAEDDFDPDQEFQGDADYEPSYALVKHEFEKTRLKVNGSFVDLYTNEGDPKLPTMLIISEHQVFANWKHIHYSVAAPKMRDGKVVRDEYNKIVTVRRDKPFLPRWVTDKKMLQKRRFVMRPDGDFDEENCYNLWKGYRCANVKSWNRENGKRIVIKFIDFVHHLLGDDKAQTMFALDWLAHPYIHPGGKPQVMACLLGPQGGGKTTFFQVHHYMMGDEQCYVTNNPDQNVYGKNGTACIADKKFINIQEVPADKVRPYIDGLRPVVTDPRLEVKTMGKDPINVDSAHVNGLSSNFLNALTVDSEEERRFWIVYATLYWAKHFLTAAELKEFFETFHEELQSDDFLGEMYRFCLKRHWVPKRFPKDAVPIGELQRVSREANAPWEIQFFKDLVENGGSLRGKPIIDLDGVVKMSNRFLTNHLSTFAESKRWEKTSMDALAIKMRFMNVPYSKSKPLFEQCWVTSELACHSDRGYQVDLDELRKLVKSDAKLIRSLHANRSEFQKCKDEAYQLSVNLKNKQIRQQYIQPKIDELKSKIEALEAEYTTLSAPTATKTVDAEDPFSAEAEYTRVMGSEDFQPNIEMPDGDVVFQKPEDEPPKAPPVHAAASSSDFMDDLFAPRPTTDNYETKEQKKARQLMLELKAKKAEQKRKADDQTKAEREEKRQFVNSLVAK